VLATAVAAVAATLTASAFPALATGPATTRVVMAAVITAMPATGERADRHYGTEQHTQNQRGGHGQHRHPTAVPPVTSRDRGSCRSRRRRFWRCRCRWRRRRLGSGIGGRGAGDGGHRRGLIVVVIVRCAWCQVTHRKFLGPSDGAAVRFGAAGRRKSDPVVGLRARLPEDT
jgi:hypothetical protein